MVALSFTYSSLLTFFCALLSLSPQFATWLLFLLPILLYLHFFALCFPLVLNLQHGCLFSSLFLLYLHFFCASLSLTHQLATRLQYPFPISLNLQQYNLFFNLVILKFLSYFSYILSKLHT